MDDKEAIEILKQMLEKYPFVETEKEAVLAAIGVLAWTKLVEGVVENRKRKRKRLLEEE